MYAEDSVNKIEEIELSDDLNHASDNGELSNGKSFQL